MPKEMKKRYTKHFKKVSEYIGNGFLVLILLSIMIVAGRTVYTHVLIALIVLISCPFMAFAILEDKESYGKEIQFILFGILLLSFLGSYSAGMGKKDANITLKSAFMKGQIKHNPDFDVQNDDGQSVSDSEYYFEEAPNQSNILSNIIDYGVFILLFGLPFLTWYIMRKDLKWS